MGTPRILLPGAATLFLTLSVGVASAGVNRWTTNGPPGDFVTALALDPNNPGTLYAANSDGIFKSTNRGGSWTMIAGRLHVLRPISGIGVDRGISTTLYAGVDLAGVFRSTNGGATWVDVTPAVPPPNNFHLHTLLVDPSRGGTLYASDATFGIFRSTDRGSTWTRILSQGAGRLAVDPMDGNRIYAGTEPGAVLRTTDAGISWQQVAFDQFRNVIAGIAIDPSDPSIVYVTSAAPIRKSTDRGDSWRQTGMRGYPLAVDPTNGQNLYSARHDLSPIIPGVPPPPPGGGVLRSKDGGESAEVFNVGLSHDVGGSHLAVEPGGKFLHLGSGNRVFHHEVREVLNPPFQLHPASQAISRTEPGTWTVSLDSAQTTETEVFLDSSAPFVVTVPVSVRIPAGSRSASFNGLTGLQRLPGTATITAVLPENLGGGIASAAVSGKPLIRGLSPSSALAGGPGFTLGVIGELSETEFAPGSRVYWNGTPRPPASVACVTLVSCLGAAISAEDIARPGTATVLVVNPPPSGATNQLTFTITAPQQVDIPTLSEWGMLALGCLLAGVGILVLRMRQP